jgi:hypothetical protein
MKYHLRLTLSLFLCHAKLQEEGGTDGDEEIFPTEAENPRMIKPSVGE